MYMYRLLVMNVFTMYCKHVLIKNEMPLYLYVSQTHSSVFFKSSLNYSQYLVQYKCYVNKCYTRLFREYWQEIFCTYRVHTQSAYKNIFDPRLIESSDVEAEYTSCVYIRWNVYIQLISTYIISHTYHCFVVRTIIIYSLINFQEHNGLLLTIGTVLYHCIFYFFWFSHSFCFILGTYKLLSIYSADHHEKKKLISQISVVCLWKISACACTALGSCFLPLNGWEALRLQILEEVNSKENCILGGIPYLTVFNSSFILGIGLWTLSFLGCHYTCWDLIMQGFPLS